MKRTKTDRELKNTKQLAEKRIDEDNYTIKEEDWLQITLTEIKKDNKRKVKTRNVNGCNTI